MGARKAKVRARRAHLREAVENILGKKNGEACARADEGGREKSGGRGQGRKNVPGAPEGRQAAAENSRASGATPAGKRFGPAVPGDDAPPLESGGAAEAEKEPVPADLPATQAELQDAGQSRESQTPGARRTSAAKSAEARPDARQRGRWDAHPRGRRRARSTPSDEGRKKSEAAVDGLDEDLDDAGEGLPFTPVEQLDAARLEALVHEAVRELVRPIVGAEVRLAISVGGGRVQVCVHCDEDSGLLIGREGQTLAALQYLISRVVSRGMNAAVRVQLDAGEYRLRQDEKLREMALALAEKVRQSGRSYSTRPLSSYHRRIVHVCLQDAEDVQTRSTGDGPMKRVVIMRKKA